MGVRNKKEKLTESDIQKILYSDFLSPSTKKYEMFNLFVYDWESDYLAITKSNYVYEAEIKISRADFFNDFKHKKDKHLILESVKQDSPNYFYYVVPNGLISVEEVPEYAGLIYVDWYRYFDIVKEAPKLNKEPANLEKLNLINKFYYGYINWRDKYNKSNINDLKSYIKQLEKDNNILDNLLSEANCEIDILKAKLNEYEKQNNQNIIV